MKAMASSSTNMFRCCSNSSSVPSPPPEKPRKLPLRKIPGDYGIPLVSPLLDRHAYFYGQGRDAFFQSRIKTHNSTVFRVNMPPGPPLSSDPRVIALLDSVSYPTLFDPSSVDKTNLFTGTFMPSTQLTGGFRVLSYLDPSEPLHSPLKKLIFFLLSHRLPSLVPEFRLSFSSLFSSLESHLSLHSFAPFSPPNDLACFEFLSRSLLALDPPIHSPNPLPSIINKWLFFQISPLLTLPLPLPKFLQLITLHSFPLPPSLILSDYSTLLDFFRNSSPDILHQADLLHIPRDVALHNILFSLCFNAYGGLKILFPNILKSLARAGPLLHARLASQIRSAVKSNAGAIGFRLVDQQMPLVKSVVYETLRIDPPVPMQYGRAKRDLVIRSHEAEFQVKAGELLMGCQPFATKDPRVFDRAEEFLPDRFVGEENEKLLKYVLWSNGPETEDPTPENKQCAGKDFVIMVARLFVVELFLRYDSFEIQMAPSPLGPSVNITSLKKATS